MPEKIRTHKPLRGRLKVHTTRKRLDRKRYARAGWRRLRRSVLLRDPWCRWPQCIEAAANVDHIVPAEWGGPDEPDNLQGLCLLHHGRKTHLEFRSRTWPNLRRVLLAKGFDNDDLQRAEAAFEQSKQTISD